MDLFFLNLFLVDRIEHHLPKHCHCVTAHQRKTLVVDIDNTLCEKDKTQKYSEAIPITKVCNALRKADKLGAYIIYLHQGI